MSDLSCRPGVQVKRNEIARQSGAQAGDLVPTLEGLGGPLWGRGPRAVPSMAPSANAPLRAWHGPCRGRGLGRGLPIGKELPGRRLPTCQVGSPV